MVVEADNIVIKPLDPHVISTSFDKFQEYIDLALEESIEILNKKLTHDIIQSLWCGPTHNSIYSSSLGNLTVSYSDKNEARKKASELLRSWLSHEEYSALKDGGLFLQSKLDPTTVYRISDIAHTMIDVYVGGKLNHYLCVTSDLYENDDIVLAKILLIKTNEKRFLRLARKYPV